MDTVRDGLDKGFTGLELGMMQIQQSPAISVAPKQNPRGDQYLSHPHVQQLWLIKAASEDSDSPALLWSQNRAVPTILSTEELLTDPSDTATAWEQLQMLTLLGKTTRFQADFAFLPWQITNNPRNSSCVEHHSQRMLSLRLLLLRHRVPSGAACTALLSQLGNDKLLMPDTHTSQGVKTVVSKNGRNNGRLQQ